MNKDIEYIEIALDEAEKGSKLGEIPVGVVVVEDNRILYKGYNKKEQLKCATRHAEIEAIENISRLKNDWRLDNCTIYVTMEPCLMCCGAIIQSRIKRVVYLSHNDKFGGLNDLEKLQQINQYNHQVDVKKIDDDLLESKYQKILRDFFIDKR